MPWRWASRSPSRTPLFIERSIGSDTWLRALELASGVLVATLAAAQLPGRARRLWERLRAPALVLRRAPPRGRLSPPRAPPTDFGGTAHDHGDGVPHDHAPAPETEVRWRALLALGVSGGLVPCPGALVVLLTAISMHRVGLGLGLLVAFSAGLAAVLSGLGLLFVLARGALDRLPTDGRVARALPVLSSTLVLGLGASIAWRALAR
jgi:ABC-type nickel/cobalt efflux system permease component RcnA